MDVRTDSEWMAERFPDAVHIHAGYVPYRWQELEKQWGASQDTPIATLCRSGHRATIAASILQQKGFTNVCNVPGGMMAWKEVGGRTVTGPDFSSESFAQPSVADAGIGLCSSE